MTEAAAKRYWRFYVCTAEYKKICPELEVDREIYEEENVTYTMIKNPPLTWGERKRKESHILKIKFDLSGQKTTIAKLDDLQTVHRWRDNRKTSA